MASFLKITDFSTDQLNRVFDRADELQRLWTNQAMPQPLRGQRVGLWFPGNGFRNRLAFEIGLQAMGAQTVYIPGELGVDEPLDDIGPYLANWLNMLVVRTRSIGDLEALAKRSRLPTINARTESNHPCEIMGDLQYIRRRRGALDGLSVVFVGPPSNLCTSWIEAAQRLAISVTQIAPPEYLLSTAQLRACNRDARGEISTCDRLADAIGPHTDVLYTDCWPGDADKSVIRERFSPFQVTATVVDAMSQTGIFLPCPPVTRGEEVSESAMNSSRCHNTAAKACLLHSQNAIAQFLAGDEQP